MRRSQASGTAATPGPVAIATCCICSLEGEAGPEIVPTAKRNWVCRVGDCRGALVARAA